MTPRVRPCGNEACRICRHNIAGEAPDSGHPEESLASLLLGAAALLLLFVLAFVLLPVLAS